MKTSNFILLVLALSTPACIDSACSKAIPVLTSAQAYVAEGLAACDQAEIVVASLADGHAKVASTRALADARSALRVAASQIALGSTACSTPDLPTLFQAFAVAWNALRPVLFSVGGAAGTGPVADPEAYLIGLGTRR